MTAAVIHPNWYRIPVVLRARTEFGEQDVAPTVTMGLTVRQTEFLQLLTDGMDIPEICEHKGERPARVMATLTIVYQKLGVSSIQDAINVGVSFGIVTKAVIRDSPVPVVES